MRDAATQLKTPHGLSPRIAWLRDYYFQGTARAWSNEFVAFTTGTPWDVVYDESSYHIVPETYPFLPVFTASALQAAHPVPLPPGFWQLSLPERRAWFVREVMVNQLPQEILPGDLIAGGRFNVLASRCWTRREAAARGRRMDDARRSLLWFHRHGYGNAGATSGHLIPDYARVLREGFFAIHADIERRYQALGWRARRGKEGAQLRAMMTAATMPRDLAARYGAECRRQAAAVDATEPARRAELEEMAAALHRVPWLPARTFGEALQALWLAHLLVLADEGYPGPGVSFGRVDQYLLPYWEASLAAGADPEKEKERLRCFFLHANFAYDAMIRVGANQGITAGYGQLITLSGLGPGGADLTNPLTHVFLDVIDELSPLLEPKPNVRLHRRSPDALLDRVVDMISRSQGAPFLLNFDERSMAGLLRQARLGGAADRIRPDNVHDYAPVGCLENTMVGNDRSGTVDCNPNLLKALQLALTAGRDLLPAEDPMTGKRDPIRQDGPHTGDPTAFASFEDLFAAFATQLRHQLRRTADLYEKTESLRAELGPTPYLSCLVGGCAESGRDVTQGGAELSYVTMEAVTFASTVDSLLAMDYLVFTERLSTLAELRQALIDNWVGHEVLQARARHRAPKYGRDDPAADALAKRVMDLFAEETWRLRTKSTGRQFRPGMLSWNYWIGAGNVLAASADGRPKGQFLSNAICPVDGADILGPTANARSVGQALGGRGPGGDYQDTFNSLPNGASHTLTFHPSLLRDAEHRKKLAAFLRGYAEEGGTALQINVLDAELLREAQRRPEDFRHLLVRVTGYNAYFASIGRELQDEIIARQAHRGGRA